MLVVQALEYHMQQGLSGTSRDDFFIMPKSLQHSYGPRYQATAAAISLLRLA